MARTIILIPPFVKYSAGPLLGPALLKSAARMRGHDCSILDLNANYIRPRIPDDRNRDGNFVGDHDKPTGDILGGIESEFVRDWLMPALPHSTVNGDERDRQLKYGFLTHDQVRYAGAFLARSQFEVWAHDLISKHVACNPGRCPQVIGLSLLHAGQVIPATALSMTVRSMWPNTLVLWGGHHDQFVANIAATPNLSIVVNYMIGFPWEETDIALAKLRHVRSTLEEHGLGDDRARVELNRFELERLAPMAKCPEAYGVESVKSWPWASVLEYLTRKREYTLER